jgi:multidrug resistance efflux pump
MSAFSPAPEKPILRPTDAPARPKVLAGKLPIFNSGVFWAATPALALFALTVFTSKLPLPTPIGNAQASQSRIASSSAWIVAASDTVLVTRQSAGKYSVLRGRLEAVKGDTVTSSVDGMVSQVSVQPGQNVRAGQQLAVLTTGIAPVESRTQAPSPLENLQSRAEAAQIAAAQQQEKLESRMNAANAELQRAKERVAIAQQRVADARELIARLQNGEQIFAAETPAAPVRSTPKRETNKAAKTTALRESQKLQDAAEVAEAASKAAQQVAHDADVAADAKQRKLKSILAAKSKATDSKGAESTPKASDTDGSADSKPAKERAAGDDIANSAEVAAARELAASAAARALDLKREAVRRQTRATQARSKANDAARRATQDLQIFDDASEAVPVPQRKAQTAENSGAKMTVAQAARIAQAAMKESDAAIKNAERIQKKVENYNRPVASTRRKFDNAAKQLEAAQQRMWDHAPAMQTRPIPVNSPRSGIVTWVAAPTTVIHSGEAVASVGRPDHLEVVVTDKSGAWKTLKPDARVLALVQRQVAANKSVAESTPGAQRATPQPVADLARDGASGAKIPTLARVIFIAPPSAPGQAARIRIAVHNPPENGNNANGTSPRAFAPGMEVFFSIAQQSRQTALRIPTAAVRRGENGKTFVAVLAPIQSMSQDRLANECRVEWREVFLAPGDGISNQVKTGLKEGERLALRPNLLYDYTLAFGPQATVSVEQI